MSDTAEWLCPWCNAIHPHHPGDRFTAPCPECGSPMAPTSQNLREIERLRGIEAELREELGVRTRQWNRLAKDCRDLTGEVVAGLATAEHGMDVVAGLPVCRCGRSLGGGDSFGSFITHALAVLAQERGR